MAAMPVTAEENEKYGKFVSEKAIELGCFDFGAEDIVWHYTNGEGFLGIMESCSLHATQVASLNDSKETKYATELFRVAAQKLLSEQEKDTAAQQFLEKLLELVAENPESPTQGISKFFVTCFSAEEDDMTQWDRYGRPNGYAIGFFARGLWLEPTSRLYKVIYDRALQEKVIAELVKATLDFFLEGLTGERLQDPTKWAEEFYAAWDEWIYRLAPLAKDYKFRAEREFRIVHELKLSDFSSVRFKQKETMLGRYIALKTPSWVKRRSPLLPIAKIIVGPGRNQEVTKISIRLLLDQMGYPQIPVLISEVPLQRP
jgi:hypothetical protein